MSNVPDLRILFPTSFSDSCFRTARAIAQLADACRIVLTIAHVTKPGESTIRTRRELDSFMAEADYYDSCHRTLLESDDAVKAIAELCRKERFDLVVAPASDRLGLHSVFNPSFRARLLKQCRTPVWTAGCCLDRSDLKQSIRTVACLVDFEANNDTYLAMAVAFACRLGARTRILSVIPPVTEATLTRAVDCNAPLMPDVALRRIQSAFAGRECPEVDVVVGSGPRELRRLLDRCDADLLFVGPGQALQGLWLPRLSRHLDGLPCPVICIDGASAMFDRWSFQDAAAHSNVRALVRHRDPVLAG